MTLALTTWLLWLRLKWLGRVRPDASLKVRVAACVIIIPLIIYPFPYGPLWWLRGLTGDLSITSLLMLLAAVYAQLLGKTLIPSKERKLIFRSIALLGVGFYPLALGIGQVDPYAWGYANPYMLGVLLGFSLLMFLRQFYVIATILLAVVLAWNVGLLQSVNLWDYLLDPFIFFYALFRLVR
ncbi:MAG: hypothetical protein Q9M75_01285 [Ghiorsea sp.]|nr:hypothetical protein [Ghiorsea sp.]